MVADSVDQQYHLVMWRPFFDAGKGCATPRVFTDGRLQGRILLQPACTGNASNFIDNVSGLFDIEYDEFLVDSLVSKVLVC